MTSENFCYWLQGLFELDTSGVILKNGLSKEQADLIHRHLKMVFYHEIDPSFGDKQEPLQKIHDGMTEATLESKISLMTKREELQTELHRINEELQKLPLWQQEALHNATVVEAKLGYGPPLATEPVKQKETPAYTKRPHMNCDNTRIMC